MVNKKVTCYSVNIPESMDFVQLLLDNEESSLKPFVLDQYRTIELKYTLSSTYKCNFLGADNKQ